MNRLSQKGQLERALMAMPISKMLDALQAIEEFDRYFLERLRRESMPEMSAERWSEEMLLRRESRAQLVELRFALEGKGCSNA